MSLSEGIRPSMLPFARVDSVELSGGGGPRRVRKGGEWATTPPLTIVDILRRCGFKEGPEIGYRIHE
jgi:hypothetical protein